MCGICGIIAPRTAGDIRPGLEAMCRTLSHRGPDDSGIFISPGSPHAGIGHRRLSIIDLSSAGHQPMSNEDNTLWIVLNGEIYNYPQLQEELTAKGHRFRSHTDTETILHLYEEYGEECVRRLRGMFAFAIWEERTGKLFLARDRVGKKPLAYCHKNGYFAFSSELASLRESGIPGKETIPAAFDHYLTFGYIPAPWTIYRDIAKLPPAHYLVLEQGKIRITRYWELPLTSPAPITEQEAYEETLRLLTEAVRIRLRSDVPLGAFLSGGVDSSIIVALMSKVSSGKVKTFSIGFEDQSYNELAFAREVARHCGSDHHELIVKADALSILPLLTERYGEPYADSSCIPTYYVAKETRRHVTVALNGDGGDELFAGYERYQGMLLAEHLRAVSPLLKGLSALLPDSLDQRNRLRNVKRFLQAAALPSRERYLRWIGIFDAGEKELLYEDAFRNRLTPGGIPDPGELIAPYFAQKPGISLLSRLLKLDTETYLPYDLLVKVDITSMANALEARSPLLDHVLMEYVTTLPAALKIRGSCKKYLLKKIGSSLVPAKNLYRRKMGFGVPLGSWLRKDLKNVLQEMLLSRRSLNRGYFKESRIRHLVKSHLEAREDHTYRLWSLLMLESWHQRFID